MGREKIEVYHNLCERLTDNIDEVNHSMTKNRLAPDEVEYIGELLDAVKDAKCIISMMKDEESGQSWARDGRGYYGGYNMPYSNGVVYNDGGMSYARGGRGGDRGGMMYQPRDSRGRYAGDDETLAGLRRALNKAQDEGERRAIQAAIDGMGGNM